jgi:hypothetical protein
MDDEELLEFVVVESVEVDVKEDDDEWEEELVELLDTEDEFEVLLVEDDDAVDEERLLELVAVLVEVVVVLEPTALVFTIAVIGVAEASFRPKFPRWKIFSIVARVE